MNMFFKEWYSLGIEVCLNVRTFEHLLLEFKTLGILTTYSLNSLSACFQLRAVISLESSKKKAI